jgi:protein involved in polysaccharide export with SLBB domain
LIVAAFIAAMLNGSPVLAQSVGYVVQKTDRMQISFWGNPDLDALVTVTGDGTIEMPVIGKVTAGGLTIQQLRSKIISQMAQYNKLITQLNIKVIEYGSNKVYITGHVLNPGKYSFEVIPNLWDIILEAGGPAQTGQLDDITVARTVEGGKVYKVNLTRALGTGGLENLPKIYPGDTIEIPGITPAGTAPQSLLAQKDVVFVLGQVATPGAHKFQTASNLVEVIAQAGGYLPEANLKKVKHIHVSEGKSAVVVEYNLDKYASQADPAPMIIRPGDTILIPRKSILGNTLITTGLTAIITVTITSMIFLLIGRR